MEEIEDRLIITFLFLSVDEMGVHELSAFRGAFGRISTSSNNYLWMTLYQYPFDIMCYC